MPNLSMKDDCIHLEGVKWAELEERIAAATRHWMIYGTYPPQRHRNVSMSAVVAGTSGPVLPKGPRFAALSALLPTSSGSTTTS